MKEFNYEAAKAGVEVQTRDGRKARIICWDKKGDYPIVALIDNGDTEIGKTYSKKGMTYLIEHQDSGDLVMAPTKVEIWKNVYRIKNGKFYTTNHDYSTKIEAEFAKDDDCIATVKIEFEY